MFRMCVDSLVLEQISQVVPPATSSCSSTEVSGDGTCRSWRFRGTSCGAFVAPPSHTSSREDDVQPVVAAAMTGSEAFWQPARLDLDKVSDTQDVRPLDACAHLEEDSE